MAEVMSIILAGGEGKRLYPLTGMRAKPAVPFAGNYRIIDFALSNFVNSHLLKIYVLTQYKPLSLMAHLRNGWTISSMVGNFISVIPPGMENENQWYRGTADAVYQNLNSIKKINADYLCVFSGDHIYKMDIREMIAFHIKRKPALSISVIPVSKKEASQFGIIEVDEDFRVIGFEEKPQGEPKTIPGRADMVLASMGNYIFDPTMLYDYLEEIQKDPNTAHDFGKDVIPKMLEKESVYAYDFSKNKVRGMQEREIGFWKDVGTLDSYWQANMDVIAPDPIFNLYHKEWRIRGYFPPNPPAKFVHDSSNRTGQAIRSLVSSGTIISGATARNSVVGRNCHIHSYSTVTDSILNHGVDIGEGANLKKCIIDSDVKIKPGTSLGFNLEEDRKRKNIYVTESGLVIVPKGSEVFP